MSEMKNNKFLKSLIFLSAALIILHPYTIYGKPGIFVAIVYSAYAIKMGIDKHFVSDFLIPCIILLVIGVIGAFSSAIHGITQYNHPLAVISFLIMLLAARGLASVAYNNNLSLNEYLYIILMVITLNSIIIIIELQYDTFRMFVEQYLDQFIGGSINYSYGYRLRGIASSGGAGLSISIPAGIIISLYLYKKRVISLIFIAINSLILLFSIVVIGRTGIILLAVPVSVYLLDILSEHRDIKIYIYILITIICSISIFPLFIDLLSSFYSDKYGEAFVDYAYGFILDGSAGFEQEGTVGMVAEFLRVLPDKFPEYLIGYGFYGGSGFEPWTDSGYSRTFLSVGFLFGILFYYNIFKMYLIDFLDYKYLIGSFFLLLVFAEAKEPLLYSGVASRVFLLLIGYLHIEKSTNNSELGCSKVQIARHIP